jgi:predicted 3-demethylubiquinone-9 3-methyltransferase (glyoxalase superfamily)
MNKMAICLWMDGTAEEAANFYTSVFKDSKILSGAKFGEEGQEITGGEPGSVMTVEFEINGMQFLALNGGPQFKPNEAVSIMVHCDTQEEINEYWEKLSAHPESEQCGWLKDKYGVSWQIIPSAMNDIIDGPDTKKAQAAVGAMLQMKKLDIAALQRAYDEA